MLIEYKIKTWTFSMIERKSVYLSVKAFYVFSLIFFKNPNLLSLFRIQHPFNFQKHVLHPLSAGSPLSLKLRFIMDVFQMAPRPRYLPAQS